MGILKLVPLNDLMALPVQVGACMVLSILFASIMWNLGTWYLGIPCSSSHTLIGSMIGGGLAFTLYYGGAGVNWGKAGEIGLSLIISPVIGFGLAMFLMYFLEHVVKSEKLFHIPKGENDRPDIWVRLMLITTCTLVSYFHGNNDGQKGVGLLMLVLIAFIPATFAIDHHISPEKIQVSLTATQQVTQRALAVYPANHDLDQLNTLISKAQGDIENKVTVGKEGTFAFRKKIQGINKSLKAIMANTSIALSVADKATLKAASKDLGRITDFAPIGVILTISLSLGFGTMIGWKRIVRTIGEKIGKEHLSYAQGASAELIAAGTIGLSSGLGLPVSTTHVLSSGVAGAMVATGGTKNLNGNTLKNIGLAWVLTLPVSIALAFVLFVLFHLFV
jgi:PiT family inorganic phosphate transporter